MPSFSALLLSSIHRSRSRCSRSATVSFGAEFCFLRKMRMDGALIRSWGIVLQNRTATSAKLRAELFVTREALRWFSTTTCHEFASLPICRNSAKQRGRQKPAHLGGFFGAGDRIRTDDILLGKQTLCQLSYTRTAPMVPPALQLPGGHFVSSRATNNPVVFAEISTKSRLASYRPLFPPSVRLPFRQDGYCAPTFYGDHRNGLLWCLTPDQRNGTTPQTFRSMILFARFDFSAPEIKCLRRQIATSLVPAVSLESHSVAESRGRRVRLRTIEWVRVVAAVVRKSGAICDPAVIVLRWR